MKFTVSTKAFPKAVNLVGTKDPRHPTPLKLIATSNGITVTSYHCNELRSLTIPATVETEGDLMGAFQLIKARFLNIPGKDVTVEESSDLDDRLRATSGAVTASFPFIYDFGDLVPPDDSAFTLIGQVPAKDLRGLFAAVHYAACRDITKPNLCGIYLQPIALGIRAAATDGHRLALSHGSTGLLESPVFIPSDIVTFLLNSIPTNSEEIVDIYFEKGKVKEEAGSKASADRIKIACGSVVVSDVADENFPVLHKVIPPPGWPIQVLVAAAPMLELLAAINGLSSRRMGCGANLDFGLNTDGEMTVSSGLNLFETEISGKVSVAGTTEKSAKVIIQARYILDAMRKAGPTPLFEVRDELSTIVVSGKQGELENSCVIMPMRS